MSFVCIYVGGGLGGIRKGGFDENIRFFGRDEFR